MNVKGRKYFYVALVLFGFVYYLNIETGSNEIPTSFIEEIQRVPNSLIIEPQNSLKEINVRDITKKQVEEPSSKLNQLDSKDTSCEELTQQEAINFYNENKEELNNLIGGWYFGDEEALIKDLDSMSDTEKFFYALAKAKLLEGSVKLKKDIEVSKQALLSLHQSDPDNSAPLIYLYQLEEDEDLKSDYLRNLYSSRHYQGYFENVYNKIYSLVNSGEGYIGASYTFSRLPSANLGVIKQVLTKKRLYHVGKQMAESSLDESGDFKNPGYHVNYILGKNVMDGIYKNNPYELSTTMMKRYLKKHNHDNEGLISMLESCDTDGVWSVVHDSIKSQFH